MDDEWIDVWRYGFLDGWVTGGVNGCFCVARRFRTNRTFPMEFMTNCSSPSLELSNPTLTSQYEHMNPPCCHSVSLCLYFKDG